MTEQQKKGMTFIGIPEYQASADEAYMNQKSTTSFPSDVCSVAKAADGRGGSCN